MIKRIKKFFGVKDKKEKAAKKEEKVTKKEQKEEKKEVKDVQEPIVPQPKISNELQTQRNEHEWYKIIKNGKEVSVTKEEFDEFMKSGGLSPNERAVSGREVREVRSQYTIVENGKEKKVSKEEFDKYVSKFPSFDSSENDDENKVERYTSEDSFEPTLIKDVNDEKGSVAPVNATEFAEDCLKWHNFYRRKHGVPDLVLDSKLNSIANDWAHHMANSGKFGHRENCDYGENIYYRSFSDPSKAVTGKDAVDDWYSEISKYQFGAEPTSFSSGHFTQIVWKSSAKLGVGMAKSGNKTYVVCNYEPAGNIGREYTQNVLPLIR